MDLNGSLSFSQHRGHRAVEKCVSLNSSYAELVDEIRRNSLDRFIPPRTLLADRVLSNRSIGKWAQINNSMPCEEFTPARKQYRKLLREACRLSRSNSNRPYSGKPSGQNHLSSHGRSLKTHCNERASGFDRNGSLQAREVRGGGGVSLRIPIEPEGVVDLPGYCDNFFTNTIDWGQTNLVAAALKNSVFVWDPVSDLHTELVSFRPVINCVALRLDNKGHSLAVGDSIGCGEIWDVVTSSKVLEFPTCFCMNHLDCYALDFAWKNTGNVIMSGCALGKVNTLDLRTGHIVSSVKSSEEPVFVLKQSPDERYVAASSMEGVVNVWDERSLACKEPFFSIKAHSAAVRAICWNPRRSGKLITGGGKDDGVLRTWNVLSKSMEDAFPTGSQICAVEWSHTTNHVLTSHWRMAKPPSTNSSPTAGNRNNRLSPAISDGSDYEHGDILIWRHLGLSSTTNAKYVESEIDPEDPSAPEVVGSLPGHHGRVLCLMWSPDRTVLATACADECLRFWRFHPPLQTDASNRKNSELLGSHGKSDSIFHRKLCIR